MSAAKEQNVSQIRALGETVSFNPATGERVGGIENTDMNMFPQMMGKAREAQKIWAAKSFEQRRRHLLKMRRFIMDNADEIATVISQENGKSRVDAMATEVLPCAVSCHWYGKKAAKVLKPKLRPTGSILFFNKLTKIEHLPVGVVGIIGPWNYPLSIPFGEVVMGLMAGNAVLLKVAAATPMTGDMIRRICEAGDLPNGLFQMVYGSGGEVSNAMLEHGVDKLFFTGSVPAGKSIMAAAAKTLTPVSLELGGNDPMIVLNDADVERAANGAIWAGFQNSGQSCGGVERLYVQSGIYDEFMAELSKKVKALRQGVPTDQHDIDLGCITTANQKKLVEEHVADAVAKGGKIIAQSKDVSVNEKGFFYPATLIENANHDMETMKHETFGPVVAAMKFDNIADAIEKANDSYLALTSSVWTKDSVRGREIAEKLESGVTTVNDHLYTHGLAETPWGGWKQSGIGRTHGHEGLKEMVHEKAINWDWLQAKRNLWWHPHTPETYQSLKDAMEFVYPTSLGKWVKSSVRLTKYLVKKSVTRWKV